MKKYTWCAFYNLLAHKILDFKNNRKQLIEIVKSIFSESNLKLPTLEKDNNIVDIDPFTVFGLFNKGISANKRKTIIAVLAKKIGILHDIPDDFSGIPVLNNLNATFYGFINDRKASDIDDLWQLFEEALKYADNSNKVPTNTLYEYIDKAVAMKGNGNSKITMGLFWVAPHKFLNLDSRNYWYIYESGKLPQEFINTLPEVNKNISAAVYFDISRKITNFLQTGSTELKTFVDLSAEAWSYSQEVNTQQKQDADHSWFPTDYTPGFLVEDWLKLLANTKIVTEEELDVLQCMQKIGGQATCSQLAAKFGHSWQHYNSNSSALGKKIIKYTNCPEPQREDGSIPYWAILYIGKKAAKEDLGSYLWKLRPELEEALKQIDLSGVKLYENEEPTIWKISHGPDDVSAEEFSIFANKHLAVVHGLTKAKGKEKETQGEKFIHKIKKGDFLYLCRGNSIRFFGQFDSDEAVINPEKQNNWYQRSYKRIATSQNTEPYTGNQKWWTSNHNSTCCKVDNNSDFEDKILRPYFNLTLADLMQNKEEMADPMIEELKNLLLSSKQIILTGAPGTGKTYMAKQIAYALTGDKADNSPHVEFCQFHPSFDYTDFVEGLRPVDKGNGNIGFERKDGIFKIFCKNALSKSVSNYDEVYDKFTDYLSENHSKENPLELKTPSNASFRVFLNSKGSLSLQTGQKNEVQGSLTKEKIKTFLTENPYEYWAGYYLGVIAYLQKNFNLTSVVDSSEQKYVFIIDEINRGDISKIFGELFYAVDPGYRGEKGKTKTQYANLISQDDPYHDGFYIPENVYIIGTMNDIDRSVESMDFAIRRRFTWKEIEAKDAVGMWDKTIPEYKDEALKVMTRLNEAIEKTESLSKAFHIGPAYFLKLKDYNGEFQKLWDLHIMPLLKEYLRGIFDAEKDLENLKAAYFDPADPATEE